MFIQTSSACLGGVFLDILCLSHGGEGVDGGSPGSSMELAGEQFTYLV